MSREELIERAKLGNALKKHEIVSTKNKYFLIDTLKANCIITTYNCTICFLCSLLKVSRYGFYQWLKKEKPEFNNWDWKLAEKIKNLYLHYQKWVTDITYILTNSKPQYLSIVRDLYNGESVDYTLNEKNNVFLSHENIIKSWYKARKPANVLLHSDQGFQYTVPHYKELCEKLNIKISMSRRRNSIDNATCKTWFSRFKNEVIYHIPRFKLKSSDVKNIVDNYIEFYNFVRTIKKNKRYEFIEYRLNNNL